MAVNKFGIDPVSQRKLLRNLQKEILALEKRTKAGMYAFALVIKGKAMGYTPTDTTDLKAGFRILEIDGSTGPGIIIHNIVEYALWVHEASGKLRGQPRKGKGHKGYYWDPQGKARPQFLLTAVNEESGRGLKIIANYARIR